MSSTAFKVLAMTIILALVLLVSTGAITYDATPAFKLGRRLLAEIHPPGYPTYGGGGYQAPTHP
ncbi:hypothetical protein ACJW30_03G058800 [Castanea mollissima]